MKIELKFKPRLFFSALAALLIFDSGMSLFVTTESPRLTVLSVIRIIILSPVAEELLFRGVVLTILSSLKLKGVKWFAIIFESVFFALTHSADAFSTALFAGIILGIVSFGDGFVPLTSAIIHIAYNGILVLSMALSPVAGIPVIILPLIFALISASVWLILYRKEPPNV